MDDIFKSERMDGDRTTWLPSALTASWGEIVTVVVTIIGYSTLASSWQAWHGSSRNYMLDLLTNGRMVHTLAMESAILGLLFFYLHRRGWRVVDLRIKPTLVSSGQGLLLIPVMVITNLVVVGVGFLIFYGLQSRYGHFSTFVASNGPHMRFHSLHVSWFAVFPALVLNGFFEEITCMGYAFNQFAAKRGPFFALAVVVLLRMSCHTYQGVIHTLGIGAAFFISGLVYWKTRNLWPLILAHIIVDLSSFGIVKLIFG